VPEVVVVEDDDVVDDADIELALDEVLAETIRRTRRPKTTKRHPASGHPRRSGRDHFAQTG